MILLRLTVYRMLPAAEVVGSSQYPLEFELFSFIMGERDRERSRVLRSSSLEVIFVLVLVLLFDPSEARFLSNAFGERLLRRAELRSLMAPVSFSTAETPLTELP